MRGKYTPAETDHQRPSTRFSKSGTSVFVRLEVDRRAYEYARMWARFHHPADPLGTAEDHLSGYLNMAMMMAMGNSEEKNEWRCPPEIEALFPPPKPYTPAGDSDDELPF